PEYDAAGDLLAFPYRGPGGGRVERRFVADLDGFDTNSEVLTRESVFGDMYLVEASRGCEWGCRFCAAGFMYRPVRYRSPDTLRAAEWLVGGGVDALKLYVMVGPPTETAEDVEAIVDLTARVRARLAGSGRPRVGRILVSINPFVPKPWTPFQWEPMEAIPSLRRSSPTSAAHWAPSPPSRSRPRARARHTCRRSSRAATGVRRRSSSACTSVPTSGGPS